MRTTWLLTLLATFGLGLRAPAQNYSIGGFTIAGGGGTSTNGQYSVSGTIGQPAASGAPMTGGNYSLTGGFWSLYAVQTEGAPLLTISCTNSAVMVSWSSTTSNWILQQNTDLNSTNWVTALEAITDNGTLEFIIANPPVGNRFFRLFRSQVQ